MHIVTLLSLPILLLSCATCTFANPTQDPTQCVPHFVIPGASEADQKYAQVPNPDNLPYCDGSVRGGGGGGDEGGREGLKMQGNEDNLAGCWYDDDPSEMKPPQAQAIVQKKAAAAAARMGRLVNESQI